MSVLRAMERDRERARGGRERGKKGDGQREERGWVGGGREEKNGGQGQVVGVTCVLFFEKIFFEKQSEGWG